MTRVSSRYCFTALTKDPAEICIIRIRHFKRGSLQDLYPSQVNPRRHSSSTGLPHGVSRSNSEGRSYPVQAQYQPNLLKCRFSISTCCDKASLSPRQLPSVASRPPSKILPNPPTSRLPLGQKLPTQHRVSRLPHGSRRSGARTQVDDETDVDEEILLVETHEELSSRLQDEAKVENIAVEEWNKKLHRLEEIFNSEIISRQHLEEQLKSALLSAKKAGQSDFQAWSNERKWKTYHEKKIRPLQLRVDGVGKLLQSPEIAGSVWNAYRRKTIEPYEFHLQRICDMTQSYTADFENLLQRISEATEEFKHIQTYRSQLPTRAVALINLIESVKSPGGPHHEFNRICAAVSGNCEQLNQKLYGTIKSWKGVSLGQKGRRAFYDLIHVTRHFRRSLQFEIDGHVCRRLDRIAITTSAFQEANAFEGWCEKYSSTISEFRENFQDVIIMTDHLYKWQMPHSIPPALWAKATATARNGRQISEEFQLLLNGGFTLCNPYTSSAVGNVQFYRLAPIHRCLSRINVLLTETREAQDAISAMIHKDSNELAFRIRQDLIKHIAEFETVLKTSQRDCVRIFHNLLTLSTARLLAKHHDPGCDGKEVLSNETGQRFHRDLLIPEIPMQQISMKLRDHDLFASPRKYLGDGSLYPKAGSIGVTLITEFGAAMGLLEKYLDIPVIATDVIYRERRRNDLFPTPYLLIIADADEITIIDLFAAMAQHPRWFTQRLTQILEDPHKIKVGWRIDRQRNAWQQYGIYATSCVDVPLNRKGFRMFNTDGDYRGVAPSLRDFELVARPFMALETFLMNVSSGELDLLPRTTHNPISAAQRYLKAKLVSNPQHFELGPFIFAPGVNEIRTLDTSKLEPRKSALFTASWARASSTWEEMRKREDPLSTLAEKAGTAQTYKMNLAAYYLATTFAQNIPMISEVLNMENPAVKILEIAREASLRLNESDKTALQRFTTTR